MSTPQSVLAQVPAVLVKRDFLDPSDLNSLLSASIAAEGDYKPSLVSQYDQSMLRSGRVNEKSRQSMQRKLEDRFAKLIVDKVVSFQDDIRNTIGVGFPELHGFEVEAVNSGDGAFFLIHIDTIHGELAHKRVISSVYYYGQSPQRFSGGELKLYSLDRSRHLVLEPVSNSMVFFPAIFPHEVLPVSVPGGAFGDGRFSINCWIYERN